MRKTVATLLGMVYLLVVTRQALPHLLFSLNQGYIQSSLCEQRANVRNCCKGSCFMRKQLRQTEQGDGQRLAVMVASAELVQWVPQPKGGSFAPTILPRSGRMDLDETALDQFHADQLVPPPWKPFLG
jgi:hypothetical protein